MLIRKGGYFFCSVKLAITNLGNTGLDTVKSEHEAKSHVSFYLKTMLAVVYMK